jgi:hypothetical protein
MTYPHPTDAADRPWRKQGREKQRRDNDDDLMTQMMRETKQSQRTRQVNDEISLPRFSNSPCGDKKKNQKGAAAK